MMQARTQEPGGKYTTTASVRGKEYKGTWLKKPGHEIGGGTLTRTHRKELKGI